MTDAQLARLVAMDIPVVIQLDGAADWLQSKDVLAEFDRDTASEEDAWLLRCRDFVDAGLHVASATDAPWTFPGDGVADDMGRPVDQIAAGMDGRLRTSPGDPAVAARTAPDRRAGVAGGHHEAAWALGTRTVAATWRRAPWATSRS